MHASVIAAVDRTPRGFEVVRVAEQLSASLDLRLVLANVVDEPRGRPFDEPDAMEQDRAARRAAAADFLREVAATMDLPAETLVRVESGDVPTVLRTLAEEEAADVVVAGSRGSGRIRAALFGSVTADLIKELSCPLLVVPPGGAGEYAAAAGRRDVSVVCGIDGSAAAWRVVAYADHLAGRLGARLHVVQPTPAVPGAIPPGLMDAPVHLRERPSHQAHEAGDLLDEAAKRIHEAPRREFSLGIGDPAQMLADIAQGRPTQLLVVAGDSPWQRLAGSASVPVAVVPCSAESLPQAGWG